ncbi:hypothetical protein OG21DRAFT_924774 [Imleria badia]|nr:hypothetical protein OG21DRAFT_924774 [Imleria badia]
MNAHVRRFQQCKLTQPLSPEQWKLIQKYMSRITAISLHSTSFYNLVLAIIAAHRPPSFEPLPPLFPKLKAVKGARPSACLPLFYCLSGPCLTQLEIPWLAGDLGCQALIDFVSDMGTIYPNMKTFSFNTYLDIHPPDAMIQGLSKTIRSWKYLVHVHLNTLDLDTAAYEHLMRLDSLTSLTLRLRLVYHCLARLREAVLPRKPFPMLTDLTFVDCDRHTPSVIEWLNCLHISPSSLTCTLQYSSRDPQQITDLYRAIAAQLCHKSLETIILEDNYHVISIQVDSIRPLFSFPRLRCVKITHFCTLSLSDGDLVDLATSWPLLEVLYLNYYVETQAPMPTLRGFFHLLQHCPRLQELVIVVDTRDSEWIDVTCPVVRNHGMHNLGLGNSYLDDPKRVASILCAIFPSLEEVDATWWYTYPLGHPGNKIQWELWQEVNRHLGELRKCRDSECGQAQVVLHPPA